MLLKPIAQQLFINHTSPVWPMESNEELSIIGNCNECCFIITEIIRVCSWKSCRSDLLHFISNLIIIYTQPSGTQLPKHSPIVTRRGRIRWKTRKMTSCCCYYFCCFSSALGFQVIARWSLSFLCCSSFCCTLNFSNPLPDYHSLSTLSLLSSLTPSLDYLLFNWNTHTKWSNGASI